MSPSDIKDWTVSALDSPKQKSARQVEKSDSPLESAMQAVADPGADDEVQHACIALPLEIVRLDTGDKLNAEAQRASDAGMFVVLSPLPPLDTHLEIAIVIAPGVAMRAGIAKVVRHETDTQPSGVEVRFVELNDRARALIGRLVADEAAFGNFHLEALIGKGGMAEVYRARATGGRHAGRQVAIKRMLPELASDPLFVDLFISEADISRSLRHPDLVEVIETGAVGATYYIAMEYIHGGTLAHLINACRQRGQPLPVRLSCHVARVVAEALDYAHNATAPNGTPFGIVHCDVTPPNVFVSFDGDVKLGDFGVVHVGSLPGPADEAVAAGKLPYMAPEQLLFEPVSPATDVFALGAVLFEMLTGRRAFDATDENELRKMILSFDVPVPSTLRSGIPPIVDRLVLHSLAPRSDMVAPKWLKAAKSLFGGSGESVTRFADAGVLARDLAAFAPNREAGRAELASFVRQISGAS